MSNSACTASTPPAAPSYKTSAHAVPYLLRTRADLEPVPLPVVARTLVDAGHPNSRVQLGPRVVFLALHTALPHLWSL
ncbi:hypothetical protein ACLBYD_15735 [Rhodococcus sp. C26F]